MSRCRSELLDIIFSLGFTHSAISLDDEDNYADVTIGEWLMAGTVEMLDVLFKTFLTNERTKCFVQ